MPQFLIPAVAAIATGALSASLLVWWLRRLEHEIPGSQVPSSDQRVDLLHRARTARFFFGVFQFVVLIVMGVAGAKTETNLVFPAIGWFLTMYFVGHQIHFGFEKRIRGIEVSRGQSLRGTLRALVVSFGFYIAFFLMIQVVARFLPGDWSIAGKLIGVAAGLFFFALASPLFVRLLVPSTRETDPETLEFLAGCFRRANLTVPDFYAFNLERAKVHNAAIAGLSWGRGPFRPALFFTRSLLTELSREEFEAVMLHEVSHISLGHVRKRVLAGIAAFVLATVALSLLLTAISLYVPRGMLVSLILLSVLASLGFQLWMVRWVVRRQELEADENAIRLGANVDDLAGALTKITSLNDMSPRRRDLSTLFNPAAAHPLLDERVAELRRKVSAGLPPVPSAWRHVRWAGPVFASVTLLVGGAWIGVIKPRRDLVKAALAGDADRARVLLESGVDPNALDYLSGHTALQGAAYLGHVEVAKVLFEKGAEADIRNRHQSTALTIASEFGRDDLVRLLIDKGADPNAKDLDGDTPLGLARHKGYSELAAFLEKSGAQDEGRKTESGRVPSGKKDTPPEKKAVSEDFSHSVIQNTCAPWDGPAISLRIDKADGARCGMPSGEYFQISIYSDLPTAAPATVKISTDDGSGWVSHCPAPGKCEAGRSAVLNFTDFAAGNSARGSYEITTRDGKKRSGVFNALWCENKELCG